MANLSKFMNFAARGVGIFAPRKGVYRFQSFCFGLLAYSLLADGPLPDPKTLNQSPPAQPDPLVDQGGQFAVYIGIFLLIVVVAVIVGIFSRRIEQALITAFGLSVIPIAFFLLSKH
jgi:hypothetical protein